MTAALREDFKEILRLIRPGSRVLDIGCGEGELLDLLAREKQVDGQGLEISPSGVSACLAKGISAVQGDGDKDLDHFPTAAFVDRFDANSYLYITRALDYFDLAASHGGVLANAFKRAREVRFCVLSFSSDWLYSTAESRDIVRALNAAGCRASFVEIETDKGHDAFFLDEPQLDSALRGFFESQALLRGLP